MEATIVQQNHRTCELVENSPCHEGITACARAGSYPLVAGRVFNKFTSSMILLDNCCFHCGKFNQQSQQISIMKRTRLVSSIDATLLLTPSAFAQNLLVNP